MGTHWDTKAKLKERETEGKSKATITFVFYNSGNVGYAKWHLLGIKNIRQTLEKSRELLLTRDSGRREGGIDKRLKNCNFSNNMDLISHLSILV